MSIFQKFNYQRGAAIPEYAILLVLLIILSMLSLHFTGSKIRDRLALGGGSMTTMAGEPAGSGGLGTSPNPNPNGGNNGSTSSSGTSFSGTTLRAPSAPARGARRPNVRNPLAD